MKYKIIAVFLILFAGAMTYWFYVSNDENSSYYKPFKLGLDLSGGVHLVYEADISSLDPVDVDDSMSALRDVIERRVNVIGVAEPLVQIESSSFGEEEKQRLIVELPGVTDIDQAIGIIQETPLLDFRIEGSEEEMALIDDEIAHLESLLQSGANPEDIGSEDLAANINDFYKKTELTGRFLERAQLNFSAGQAGLSEPAVSLVFNQEGTSILARITKENLGKTLAIFLDGEMISAPVVRAVITNGEAQISGGFSVEEARDLAKNLNLGALPVPISLVSTQSIGPSLGEKVLDAGIRAGLIGLLLVALFMIVWYRLPGLIAVVSLAFYLVIILSLFKLIPVTLTAAGIAGFILSIGLAVDANILIFERFKEELKKGDSINEAIKDGFARAWLSIRDSNLSSIISAVILFWFGTSLIQGFALTFGLGVLVSMFTAISVTRTLLLAAGVHKKTKLTHFLFGSGIKF